MFLISNCWKALKSIKNRLHSIKKDCFVTASKSITKKKQWFNERFERLMLELIVHAVIQFLGGKFRIHKETKSAY